MIKFIIFLRHVSYSIWKTSHNNESIQWFFFTFYGFFGFCKKNFVIFVVDIFMSSFSNLQMKNLLCCNSCVNDTVLYFFILKLLYLFYEILFYDIYLHLTLYWSSFVRIIQHSLWKQNIWLKMVTYLHYYN